MKIHNILIENFRGISRTELHLEGKSSVLFGENGTGKSSVLDCLAIMLSRVAAGVSNNRAGAGRRQFQESDIQIGYKVSQSQLNVKYNNSFYTWSLSKNKDLRKTTIKKNNQLSMLVHNINEELEANSKANIPLSVYYPVNRAVLDVPLRIRKKHFFDQISSYEGALTSGADFRVFFEWFRAQEDLENEIRVRTTKNYIDPLLNAVRKAIYSFLPGFTDIQVSRYPLRMIIHKGNIPLEVNQLSQGEKCMLAMVGDLARRLAIANPNLEEPLMGEGLVLIDEIELHLHPSWQRKILDILTTTFPNLQFIVTTHSPQVLGETKKMNTYILKWNENSISINKSESLYGRDTNRILEDYMDSNSRDKVIDDKIKELFKMITHKNLDKAVEIQNRLIEILGDEEPELIKADVILKRWRKSNNE
ncbi:AAA family ATPase [Paenibacillus sp. CFBP13512]|uniref:AAA family ATPase n=1 Tax=Paenibacillus sp. CFBP13512 TaxID=2184007 RepID=UPI001375B22A|nr:AAA family ATPase [Paenibacillus sp. CFBP13512]